MITLRNKLEKDSGFTLIELMIVVLIIAILIAIGIPTFLGARKRSQDSQAKSHIRAALVSEKTFQTDGDVYTANIATLKDVEANLQWGNINAAQRGVVVENVDASGKGVVLKSLSSSGTLFCIADMIGDFSYVTYALTKAGTYYANKKGADASSNCLGTVWEVTSTGWS